MSEKKYSYERFGCNSTRVGQAVYDLSKQREMNITVEELLEETNKRFIVELENSIKEGERKFKGTFYVFVLGKKELTQFGVSNVDRNWFIVRRHAPLSYEMMADYPNYTKTLYEVNPEIGFIEIKWSVPGWQDCKTIMKNPSLYDRDLVTWVRDAVKPLQGEAAS